MRKAYLLSLIGLLVGLLMAWGVIEGKRILLAALMGELQDELSKACPCTLTYDSAELSLLRLRAVGRNIAIREDQKTRLRFETVTAEFSLSDITNKTVRLTDLTLSKGYSVGIDDQSTTYKFIDQLSTPPPPDRRDIDRWRIKLERLKVEHGRFTERMGIFRVRGRGVSLTMSRNERDNFELSPRIDNLQLVLPPHDGRVASLGSVDGLLEITDPQVEIKKLRLTRHDARMEIEGAVLQQPRAPFLGDLHFSLNESSVGLKDYVSLALYGAARVSGRLGAPELAGTYSLPSAQPFSFRVPSPFNQKFVELKGGLALQWNEQSPVFSLHGIEGSGPGLYGMADRPLTFSAEGIEGGLTFRIDRLSFGNAWFDGVSFDVAIKHNWVAPAFDIKASADTLVLLDKTLGSASATAHYNGSTLTFDAGTNPLPHGLPFLFTAQGAFDTENSFDLLPTKLSAVPSVKGPSFAGLTAQATVRGPLDLSLLEGAGDFSLLFGPYEVPGELQLSQGMLRAQGTSEGKHLSTSLTLPITGTGEGSWSVEVNKALLAVPTPKAPSGCSELSGTVAYHFPGEAPLHGDGRVTLSEVVVGCQPVALALHAATTIEIAKGVIQLPRVSFTNQSSALIAEGSVDISKGFDLHLAGGLEFQALAPLLGTVDNVQGTVALNARVVGPLTAPNFSGTLSVQNAALELESSGTSIRNLEGTLTIAEEGLEFSSVRGRLNDGRFTLSGRIEPLSLERSVATMSFEEVLFEPLPELSALVSGTLGIGPDRQGVSALSGVITVDSAEFKRTTSLGELLQSSARSLFRSSRTGPALPEMGDLPALPIDIKLQAPGNVLVDTTWGAGELKGDLQVRGTLREPQPEGSINVISGWVGLRDRRFELTNGTVTFTPPSLDPVLDVLAETTIRSRQGDVVLVLLEARGNASAPRLILSSDRGLTEREILNLFAAPGDSSATNRVSAPQGGIAVDALEFIEDRSFLGLGRLVRDLARIDSLSLEPTFNTQRGVVEPSLIATKRLFDHLSLVGETPLSGGQDNSRLRLIYDITPAVDLSGTIDTVARDQTTSLGFDVGYTLLGARRRFLDIRFSGNRMFRGADIEAAVLINQDTRLREADIPRVEERIRSFYRSQGFFKTSAKGRCESVPGFSDSFCHQLLVDLTEGLPSYIERITISGDVMPETISVGPIERRALKSVATEAARKDFESTLTRRLRSEGYISARVESSYKAIRDSEGGRARELIVNVSIGNPVTFVFSGNTVFGPEAFLETINLFGRKQPFGNNTISILQANIVRLYNERGYLFASTSVERNRDEETGRITFDVTIDEGVSYRVHGIELRGLALLSPSDVRASIEQFEPDATSIIFSPEYAVPDQLQTNTETLERALVEKGFPEARVAVLTEVDSRTATVTIVYVIEEGEPQLVQSIQIIGAPEDDKLPLPPPTPLSIPEVNRYTQDLSRALAEIGYRASSIQAKIDSDSHALTLEIARGPQQFIERLIISGNSAISEEVIRGQLLLIEGAPLREDQLQESKRRLLRLGLFGQVETTVEPSASDPSRHIVGIRVHERSLRTLSLGTGLNSELGLHLFGEASDRATFGDGRSLTARLDAYYDRVDTTVSQGIASLTFADPTAWRGDFGYVSDLRFQRLDLSAQEFDLDRISLANYLHRSWESGTTVSLGHTILFENLDDVSPGAIVGPYDTGSVRLSYFTGSATLDERDDPLNPTKGFTASFEPVLSAEAIGSEADYGGGTARVSFLSPLPFISTRWSLAVSATSGALWTFGDTSVVPISQRFYLGGRTSVRGFREDSLGPKGDDGAVQGGDFFASQSVELRYLIGDSTSVLGFLDAGGLYFMDRPISIDDYRESAGFGIRYLSPIGPVGFDLGIPLDERSGEPSFRVHFNIGTNF